MVIRDFPASRLLSAAYSLSPKVFPSEHMLVPVWCCVPTESFKCTQGIGTATYTLMTLSWIQLTSPTKTLILATSGQIVILDHMFFCKGQTQPNTLRKVERKNICGGQITLTFIHEMLISWGQTFHFSEYLTLLFFNSPILSSVDTNLPWSPAALINYWMTWSPRSWTSPPSRSRACNIGILERVQVLINIPQGWFSTQVPSRGNASFCLFTSCCLTWSSASPCWAWVATVCWQVK